MELLIIIAVLVILMILLGIAAIPVLIIIAIVQKVKARKQKEKQCMSMQNNPIQQPGFSGAKPPRSIMNKVITIFLLVIALLLPLGLIYGVVAERQERSLGVQKEITQKWGSRQTVIGPILVIPYSTQGYTSYAYVLPRDYKNNNQLKPDIHYRGIFKTIVYTDTLTTSGEFNLNALNNLKISKSALRLKDAFITVGISQRKGIASNPVFKVSGKTIELLPGTNGVGIFKDGLYTPFALEKLEEAIPFSLSLALNGSEVLSVVPIGKHNNITMTSTWNKPSFIGILSPSTRNISNKGFEANWDIPSFGGNLPSAFTSNTPNTETMLNESTIGTSLLPSVDADAYKQTVRAIKYGILFFVLTFATYFLFEMITKQRLHPFQYTLVGCALCLFYLLLIALSEIIDFMLAYIIASIAIVSIITLYSQAIIGKIKKNAQFIIGGGLALLYSFLYVLLQLEDLSLLIGTLGLFIVLGTIMYITRNINWFTEKAS